MLFFIGLPGLFIYRNNGQDRKYYVPVAIPYALYHLFNLLNLFSSFLIEEVPTFGPAQGVLPPIIGSLLNQLVKTYRIRLWIVTALTHFVLYVWYIIWVVRVQESGGIPGHRLVKSKKE
ncbi:hypothetical protein BDR26DRAFT_852031 [Obelidium mucronatum]|nr:hypothetical protein BDR26DRAFT_852031 [Obelidium mucronatum]